MSTVNTTPHPCPGCQGMWVTTDYIDDAELGPIRQTTCNYCGYNWLTYSVEQKRLLEEDEEARQMERDQMLHELREEELDRIHFWRKRPYVLEIAKGAGFYGPVFTRYGIFADPSEAEEWVEYLLENRFIDVGALIEIRHHTEEWTYTVHKGWEIESMSYHLEIDGKNVGGTFVSLAAAKRFAEKQHPEKSVEIYEEKPNGMIRIDGWEVRA